MRNRDTVPEHPLRAAERENTKLRDEVKFLHEALFFTEILAAVFFGAFLALCSSAGWL